MSKRKKSFPVYLVVLISLILLGNIAFSYIVGLIVGNVELNIGYLTTSLLVIGSTLFLTLRIIYQIDKRGSRLKRRIKWFEPVEET
jgi:hypothetical protein